MKFANAIGLVGAALLVQATRADVTITAFVVDETGAPLSRVPLAAFVGVNDPHFARTDESGHAQLTVAPPAGSEDVFITY